MHPYRFVFLLFFTFFRPHFLSAFCLNGCKCSDDEQTFAHTVNCDGAEFANIPTSFNPFVRSLKLSNNKISAVKDELRIYKELEFLDLSENGILNIDRSAFQHLQKLKALRLNGNSLAVLVYETFMGLNELRALDLSANRLNRLATSIFVELRRLETLNVSENSITELSPGAFTGLSSLKELHIQHNELKTIPKPLWNPLVSLKVLDLSYNQLETLESRNFANLKQLEVLNLAGNNLETIDENAFVDLQNLRQLNLDQNRLKRVPTLSFPSLTDLNVLSLSENSLGDIPTSAFEGLSRLRQLTISRCPQLKSVAVNAFSGLYSLQSLILTENRALTNIDPLAFELRRTALSSVDYLDDDESFSSSSIALRQLFLFNNNLSSLPSTLLPWHRLDILDLRVNPWTCDCDFGVWIGGALRKVYSKRGSFPDGAVCHSPDHLRNRPLHTLRSASDEDDTENWSYSPSGSSQTDFGHCQAPWIAVKLNLAVVIALGAASLFMVAILTILCIKCRRKVCCCHDFNGNVFPLKNPAPQPPGLPQLFRYNQKGQEEYVERYYYEGDEFMDDDVYYGPEKSCKSKSRFQPRNDGYEQARRNNYEEKRTFLPIGAYANTSDYYSGISSNASTCSPGSSAQISPPLPPMSRNGSFRVIQQYPVPITEL